MSDSQQQNTTPTSATLSVPDLVRRTENNQTVEIPTNAQLQRGSSKQELLDALIKLVEFICGHRHYLGEKSQAAEDVGWKWEWLMHFPRAGDFAWARRQPLAIMFEAALGDANKMLERREESTSTPAS